jgi:hypothetical protein
MLHAGSKINHPIISAVCFNCSQTFCTVMHMHIEDCSRPERPVSLVNHCPINMACWFEARFIKVISSVSSVQRLKI